MNGGNPMDWVLKFEDDEEDDHYFGGDDPDYD
jgi:hypothetical protein